MPRLLLAVLFLVTAGIVVGAGLGRAFLSAWGPAPHARPATALGAELLGLRMERLRRLERELREAKAPEQEREANRRAWEDYWSACEAACARYGVEPPPWAARLPEGPPVRPE
jgi:hypothetical protein